MPGSVGPPVYDTTQIVYTSNYIIYSDASWQSRGKLGLVTHCAPVVICSKKNPDQFIKRY